VADSCPVIRLKNVELHRSNLCSCGGPIREQLVMSGLESVSREANFPTDVAPTEQNPFLNVASYKDSAPTELF
jgi:hypothetical protein